MAIRKVFQNQETFSTNVLKNKDRVEFGEWNNLDEQGEFKMIDKKNIYVDDSYQRSVGKMATEIAKEFSWAKFGVVSVAKRGGKYFCFDSQHRVMAACMRSDITKLPCLVFRSSGMVMEAKAFLGMNDKRSKVSAIHKFKVRVATKDKEAVRINEILNANGFKVSTHTGQWNFTAVGCAVKAHKYSGPDMFDFSLKICATWYEGYAPGRLMLALATMEKKLAKIGKTLLDYESKIGTLAVVSREVKKFAVTLGCSETYAIHEAAILNLMNKGKRIKKIRLV